VAKLPRAARGVDAVEARLDLYPKSGLVEALRLCGGLERTGTPSLATCRLAAEGGGWADDNAERAALLGAATAVCSMVDVELKSRHLGAVRKAARGAGCAVVVSHHNFERTPPRTALDRLIRRAASAGADIVKMALMVRSAKDHATLVGLMLEHRRHPLCLLGMGAAGLPLRVYLSAIGSLLAYATLGKPTAPGQPTAADLRAALRACSASFRARTP
jgi:3-dehydroquinate dehydratase-1